MEAILLNVPWWSTRNFEKFHRTSAVLSSLGSSRFKNEKVSLVFAPFTSPFSNQFNFSWGKKPSTNFRISSCVPYVLFEKSKEKNLKMLSQWIRTIGIIPFYHNKSVHAINNDNFVLLNSQVPELRIDCKEKQALEILSCHISLQVAVVRYNFV